MVSGMNEEAAFTGSKITQRFLSCHSFATWLTQSLTHSKVIQWCFIFNMYDGFACSRLFYLETWKILLRHQNRKSNIEVEDEVPEVEDLHSYGSAHGKWHFLLLSSNQVLCFIACTRGDTTLGRQHSLPAPLMPPRCGLMIRESVR